MDQSLEEQMRMLEGVNIEEDEATPVAQPVQPQVAPQPAFVPFPETAPAAQPQAYVPQNAQVNNQAFAQVVQPTTTNVGYQAPVQPVYTQPQQPVYTQPVYNQPMQPQVAQQQFVPQGVKQNLDMNQAPRFANLNTNSYTTKTDFFNLKKEERTRITLINPAYVYRVHAHYLEGLGWYKCLSIYDSNDMWPETRAVCCMEKKKDDPSKYENAKSRLLVPIIEYPVSRKDGRTIEQGLPKLKMWNMNYLEEKAFKEVLTNYATNPDDLTTADVSQFDLLVSVDQTSKFPTKKFTSMPSMRAQFGNAIETEIAKTIGNQEALNEFFKVAIDEAAKTLTEEKIAQALNAKYQANQMAQSMAQQPMANAADINLNI